MADKNNKINPDDSLRNAKIENSGPEIPKNKTNKPKNNRKLIWFIVLLVGLLGGSWGCYETYGYALMELTKLNNESIQSKAYDMLISSPDFLAAPGLLKHKDIDRVMYVLESKNDLITYIKYIDINNIPIWLPSRGKFGGFDELFDELRELLPELKTRNGKYICMEYIDNSIGSTLVGDKPLSLFWELLDSDDVVLKTESAYYIMVNNGILGPDAIDETGSDWGKVKELNYKSKRYTADTYEEALSALQKEQGFIKGLVTMDSHSRNARDYYHRLRCDFQLWDKNSLLIRDIQKKHDLYENGKYKDSKAFWYIISGFDEETKIQFLIHCVNNFKKLNNVSPVDRAMLGDYIYRFNYSDYSFPDNWGSELEFKITGATITVMSPGPDGVEGTEDDVSYVRSFEN